MKLGKSLTELASEIERQAASKKDYLCPVGKLGVVADAQGTQLQVGANVLPINELAHGQLAEYVGIPLAYYRRMQKEAPQLLAGNVNRWLQDHASERRMVRCLDGGVRAFLSDKYRPLENFDLAHAVLPVLKDLDLILLSAEITETRMYIKAVDKRITRDIPAGHKLGDGSHVGFRTQSPGIVISNSEVGFGRLLIEHSIFDGGCTNLALFGHVLKKQHVGARNDILGDDVFEMLTDETKKLTDAALWGQVRDVVAKGFDKSLFDAKCDKLVAATQDEIPVQDVVEVVNVYAKRKLLTEDVTKSIVGHLVHEGNINRFGLAWAVNRASADVASYDDATAMERMAGEIIELPKTSWQELLKEAA